MRDFNFFRSYQKHTVKTTSSQQNLIIAVSVSAILVASVYGFYSYKMYVMQKDMDRMNAYMVKPENVATYKKFTETKNKLALLNVYYDLANKLNLMIENDAVLNSDLIERFEKALPPEVSIQSINLNDDTFEIQGVTDGREIVAEFQNNLIESGDYKDVFVSGINHATDLLTGDINPNYYVFSITCELKEGIDR